MKVYDATEEAYKNGYRAGRESAIKIGTWHTLRDNRGKIEGWIHKNCGRISQEASKYCPLCGAEMRKIEG